jgi:aspartyl-tRNA(Asn)/glutamyl-tRNA(Gln) amidotransferase subunit B
MKIDEFPIAADVLGTILARIGASAITVKSGRELFTELLRRHDEEESAGTVDIDTLIDERGLRLVAAGGALDAAIESAIAASGQAVADFRAGKQQALGSIIGRIMREVRGADAKAVREQLLARLNRE